MQTEAATPALFQPLDGIIVTPDEPGGLVALAKGRPVLDIFTDEAIIAALLEAIREEAKRDFTPDTTTEKGRKAIASQAFRVAKTKTYLDELGKVEVARLKELPKSVDAGRKTLRDGLDALRDEIRLDLDQWEARVQGLKDRLAKIQNLPATLFSASVVDLQNTIARLIATEPSSFEEIQAEAATIKSVTLATLQELLEKRQKFEADQAELARLREEKAERDRLDAEEKLRKEGEERARKELEARTAPAPAPAEEPVPMMAHDDSTMPPPAAPAPTVAAPITVPQADDVEHRRALNREALAAIRSSILAQGSVEVDDIATAVLRAIVLGQVPHVSITY